MNSINRGIFKCGHAENYEVKEWNFPFDIVIQINALCPDCEKELLQVAKYGLSHMYELKMQIEEENIQLPTDVEYTLEKAIDKAKAVINKIEKMEDANE